MRYSRLRAKKLFVYASHYAELFEEAAGFGWRVGAAEFDWPTLLANKDAEIERLNGIYIKTSKPAALKFCRIAQSLWTRKLFWWTGAK